ncbi:MAG: GntR family transcriptional regulator [Rhizobiaceae bacterium]|nr:GntR family transcriptional regulator [Rhizobiaceae bacterium]
MNQFGKKTLKKDQAYDTIKMLVLDTEDPGMIYSERFLASQLDFGLASIRSALERLRSEDLVEMIPKSGVRVPQITYREVMDFFEVRMLIEPHIAERLAGKLNPAQSRDLSQLISKQKHAAKVKDTVEYHRLDLEFHSFLANTYGNHEMITALGQMQDKMYRLSKHIHKTHPDRLAINVEQHQNIVEAILKGDEKDARAAMELHLKWGRDVNIAPVDRFR